MVPGLPFFVCIDSMKPRGLSVHHFRPKLRQPPTAYCVVNRVSGGNAVPNRQCMLGVNGVSYYSSMYNNTGCSAKGEHSG